MEVNSCLLLQLVKVDNGNKLYFGNKQVLLSQLVKMSKGNKPNDLVNTD